ncbi:MAG: DUF1207 domain-containing protein [Bacteroidales bacterium]|nr:DUF1207 domain-containing protein [Bacteroidales bacterium]
MGRVTMILLLWFIPSSLAHSQDSEYFFFRESGIMMPFISEIRSEDVKIELGYLNKLDHNYYITDYTSRPFVEVHLGTRLPLFSMVNRQENLKFSTGGYISSVILLDMFEETTSPVINTDYFFGFHTSILKSLDHKYLKNVGLKLIPVFHESTHLGDEFSLYGYNTIPNFRRINLSFEAWEVSAVVNDPENSKTNLLSVKAGYQGLWNYDEGYYTTDSLEAKGITVPSSKKNYEYYLQLNLQRTRGFLCSDRWMNILSVEANNRLKFSYDTNIPEKRTWNFNLYFGWEFLSNNAGRNIGFYVRHYNGIIPHGQFRDTEGFQFTALSVVYR